MRILHTADLHFSNNPDKLEESIRTTDFILEHAKIEQPDVIILAGDTVDEHDGRIRIDSEAARAAISFVRRAADISPVIMVRGTRSHDRDTPYLFRHLQARHPIHVSDKIEMAGLHPPDSYDPDDGPAFFAFGDPDWSSTDLSAVFTCVPSLDKATLVAQTEGLGIKLANAEGRSLFNDMFTAIGEVNASISVPRIMVGHGMVTGSQFSSGQTAIGEDLEFGVTDICKGGFDYVALGHVHKFQQFPGNIFYSGSPGRMNFGEQEEKGFLVIDFYGRQVKEVRFIPTPARRFALYDCTWDNGGLENILQQAEACEADCFGADVRFRYTIPEEEKHCVDRAALEERFIEAGARKVKIECQVIPVVRQRAAGISRLSTLPEKVQRWGESTGQEIPKGTMDLAAVIEGRDVGELIADAMSAVGFGSDSQDAEKTEERQALNF
jgi:exonuclease SbcD